MKCVHFVKFSATSEYNSYIDSSTVKISRGDPQLQFTFILLSQLDFMHVAPCKHLTNK